MQNLTGRGIARTYDGVTRRDFLQVVSLGASGLMVAGWQVRANPTSFAADADDRACIMIFNLGIRANWICSTMKPDAPVEICGPFKPIKTKVAGIHMLELLSLHAEIADKSSLVRSCNHTDASGINC